MKIMKIKKYEEFVSINEEVITTVDADFGIVKITDQQGDTWYLKKIDTTHFFMSNNAKYLKEKNPNGFMVNHIAQHKQEPYYKAVQTWLRS